MVFSASDFYSSGVIVGIYFGVPLSYPDYYGVMVYFLVRTPDVNGVLFPDFCSS